MIFILFILIAFGKELELREMEEARRHNQMQTECPHWGAPLQGGKCDYCGKVVY